MRAKFSSMLLAASLVLVLGDVSQAWAAVDSTAPLPGSGGPSLTGGGAGWVSPTASQRVRTGRQAMARQAQGRATRHTELPGNINNVLPTAGLNQMMNGMNALFKSKIPMNLGQMFGGNLLGNLTKMVQGTARGGVGAGGLGGLTGLASGLTSDATDPNVENACKTAAAEPVKSTKILASPIVAFAATPISTGNVCPNDLITCIEAHYRPSELNDSGKPEQSPVGSGTPKCNPGQSGYGC
jgi:hypothetical protein